MLNKKQLDFCKHYVSSCSASEAYKHAYKVKNKGTCNTGGSRLLKSEEIMHFIDKLRKAKEQQIIEGRKKELDVLKDQVLSEIELDFLHSQICRGNVVCEEIYQVREYVPVQYDDKGGIVPGSGRWAVTFKRVTRPPNIREMQISSDILYKRKGSYAPLRFKPVNNNDEDEQGQEPEERYIILSDGKKLPFPAITNKS